MKTSLAPLSIARLSPTELYSGASKTVEYYFEFETHAPTHRRKALGPWAVAAVLFFTVAGSPVGIELAVAAGGPLYAILGVVTMSMVWCIPAAFVAAELSTAFPEDAGAIAWVSEAFGETAGYVEGTMYWASCVVDLAAYPILIAQYGATLLDNEGQYVDERSLCIFITVVLTTVNYCGLKNVGNLLIGLSAFCLVPFLVMVVLGAPSVDPIRWADHQPVHEVQWGLLLNTLFWNLNHFDSVGNLAAEVQNPAQTFPKAMKIVVPLVVLMYLAVVMVCVGVSPPGTVWRSSQFAEAAQHIGGHWLHCLVVAATVASCIGQFEAETSETAHALLGMAERRMLPSVLATRSRFDTPSVGIWSGMVIAILCFQLENLAGIVELLNVVYVYAALLQYAAFISLRFKKPSLLRPYRAPVSNVGAVLMLLPTIAFTLLVLALASWRAQVIAATVGVFSLTLAKSMQMMRSYYPELFLNSSEGLSIKHATINEHALKPYTISVAA
eukprot:m.127955 g.127955  ORF g.127955 m.127955 type:complete len:498 (-) comp13615_c0_seq4:1866-3359(-)